MKIVMLVLLFLAGHFSLTAFVPGPKALLYWPFGTTSSSWLPFIGGLPNQSGAVITPLLAGLAGLGFWAAAASLMGWLVPADWFRPLVLAASAASAVLFLSFASPTAIVPLVLDAFFAYGLLAQHWTAAALRG